MKNKNFFSCESFRNISNTLLTGSDSRIVYHGSNHAAIFVMFDNPQWKSAIRVKLQLFRDAGALRLDFELPEMFIELGVRYLKGVSKILLHNMGKFFKITETCPVFSGKSKTITSDTVFIAPFHFTALAAYQVSDGQDFERSCKLVMNAINLVIISLIFRHIYDSLYGITSYEKALETTFGYNGLSSDIRLDTPSSDVETKKGGSDE